MALKATWKNIRRSPYQAFAAILIMTLTFLVISFFTFILVGASLIINYFESKPTLTAFFRNEAKEAEIKSVEESVKATGKVASVKFVSKKEALEIYREQNKNDPLLLDLVTEDILPASLEISAVRVEDLSSIQELLKSYPVVSEIIYQEDIVSILTSWTDALRKIGVGIIAILALVSIFVMGIITGVKISHKKDDIEIMRLIGASSWYVRWPFILEGVSYGVVGAILGWGIAAVTLWYSGPYLEFFLKDIPIFPVSVISLLALLGMELVIAVFLGAFSSFLAVLRYLK